MTKLNSLVQKIRALVSPFAVPETLVILVLILFAGFSRLIPHPWNFTAIGAMALFSGHQFQHKVLAFVAPFLTLLWTDTVLGFHDTMVFVYFSVALVTLMGFWTQNSVSRVIGGSLFGSTFFFSATRLTTG